MPWPWKTLRFPKGTGLDVGILMALGLAFLSPILLSPHFGLFSDSEQLLSWPAKSLQYPAVFLEYIRPLGDGRWTPMFHIVTIALYAIFGPHAFWFFLFQGLTLLVSLGLSYLLTRWMSGGSRLAGLSAGLLVLASAPMAENYFTLDKVEPRLVLFSLLSMTYFAWRLNRAELDQHPTRVFCAHFGLAVLLIFSKETGAFLAGVAVLGFLAIRAGQPRDHRLLREAGLFLAAVFTALVLFFALDYLLAWGHGRELREQNGGLGRYLNYSLTWKIAADNAREYLTRMPETFAALAVFLVWSLAGLRTVWSRNWETRHIFLFLTGSGGGLYLAGMLLWRFRLIYYLLPAVVLLSIAASAAAFSGRRKLPGVAVAGVLIALAASQGPIRARTGWAVLALDRAKDQMLQIVEAELPSHARVAIAMFDVRSAEIGRSIEMYLSADHIATQKGDFEPAQARVYNFIEGPWVNRADAHRYDGSEAEPPTPGEIDAARQIDSTFLLWQYSPMPRLQRVWWMDSMKPGDLIVMPVGSPSNAEIPARGAAAFVQSAESILHDRFHGLATRRAGSAVVRSPLSHDFLGWEVVEVTALTALDFAGLDRDASGSPVDGQHAYLKGGWSLIGWAQQGAREDAYRWGYNGAGLIVPQTGKGLELDLEPNGKLGLPLKIRALDHTGKELAAWPMMGRLKVSLTAPAGEAVTLRIPDQIPTSPDTICFRLFGLAGK
jgi:hypothetical protein